MLKRPLTRSLTALSLTLLLFCAAASPARAWAANPGDPVFSLWSNFLIKVSTWFLSNAGPAKTGSGGVQGGGGGAQGGTAQGGQGGTGTLSCPPNNPNCGTNEDDNGTGANPLGKP